MTEQQPKSLPEWAEQDRASDLAWINENLQIFWPMAQEGYKEVGRGTLAVDTARTFVHPGGVGHPLGYFPQEAVERLGDPDTQRLVREYDPDKELVTTLFKTEERVSSYRLLVMSGKPREDYESRVEPKAQAQTPDKTTTQEAQPPDLETLIAWEAEGYCDRAVQF